MSSKTFYVWTRDLHYYFGLFLSPYVLLFAVTTILLNHSWKPGPPKVAKSTAQVEFAEGIELRQQGRHVLDQLNLAGEINVTRRIPRENKLLVAATKPGYRVRVHVDLDTKMAEIEEESRGFLNALVYLHINPGPHRVRGANWFFSKVWGWLADTAVYLLFFLSISGIYMWAVIKAERKIGLILIGAGCISFAAILTALL